MRVACLTLYPLATAPGSRFRCEQYVDLLMVRGVEVNVMPLLTMAEYSSVKRGIGLRSLSSLLKACLRRLAELTRVWSADVVWLYREAAPFGPPVFEWTIRYLLRKPIVYDFDDAIWMEEAKESRLVAALRCRWKVASLCRMAAHVAAGNGYLGAFAERWNDRVSLVPTTVDVVTRFNAVRLHNGNGQLVVGWTGSRSTNRYLKLIDDVLCELRTELSFEVVIVSDERPAIECPARFIAWNADSEVEQLLKLDIGLMPLDDTEWSKGKCGFKLIQYMSLGIPPVASAVGANADIVRDGVDGFLCTSREDWKRALRALIGDPALRREMGRNARERVECLYAASRQADVLADIFHTSVANAAGRSAPVGARST